MSALYDVLMSGAVLSVIALIYSIFRSWIGQKAPAWALWEPVIIAAIRRAEEAIPDDTPNKSAQRFDYALQRVLLIIDPDKLTYDHDAAFRESISEGIRITHAALENDDSLAKGE